MGHPHLKTICVYCGSSPGSRREYIEAARLLGRELAGRGLGLVYGGGSVGLMGLVARATLEAGGQVTGVITSALVKMEVALKEVSELVVVETMHERKARMAELSDGFICLPGGLGTIEEMFEVFTWGQLGLHHKPCGLLNINGYYDKLLDFLDHAVAEKFIEASHRNMILVDTRPTGLLEQFAAYQPPRGDKAAWVLEMTRDIKD